MTNVSPIVGLAGLKVMMSPVRQVIKGVDVGARVVVARGVLVGARVKAEASRRVAVGNGRRVAMGHARVAVGRARVAVGGNACVASGETNSSPGLFTGEIVAVAGAGCGVAVAVLVAHSVGIERVVGVKVGEGMAVGCGVSVTRAKRSSCGAPSIRPTAVMQAQPANTTKATRPPAATSNRRARWRLCSLFAAL
jgi:hypothetical protein